MIDQVDDVVAAGPGAVADTGAGDGHAQMGLAAACSADQDEVALAFQEGAGGQIPDQGFVHRAGGEVEVASSLAMGSLAMVI